MIVIEHLNLILLKHGAKVKLVDGGEYVYDFTHLDLEGFKRDGPGELRRVRRLPGFNEVMS